MSGSRTHQLNYIRAFEATIRLGSARQAAEELCVTPGAISHQLRSFEQSLGCSLFERSRNKLIPTEYANGLYTRVAGHYHAICRALADVNDQPSCVVLVAPKSFVELWLTPRLLEFYEGNSNVTLDIRSTTTCSLETQPQADLTVRYRSHKNSRISVSDTTLLEDYSRPLLTTTLAKRLGKQVGDDLESFPLVASAHDNWDWKLWFESTDQIFPRESVKVSVNNDRAALDAAAAHLGVVLVPEFVDTKNSAYSELTDATSDPSIFMGSYGLSVHSDADPSVDRFARWLTDAAHIKIKAADSR